MLVKRFHHACVVCTDYAAAVDFYVRILGLTLQRVNYSAEKRRHKLELFLNGEYLLELFVQEALPRKEQARAGLAHLSFLAPDVERAAAALRDQGVPTDPVQTDGATGKRYVFFYDPDGQKLELYEE